MRSGLFRIFISSTWQDLQPEREAVEKALHRLHDTIFNGMEYFGSKPGTPKEVSLAEVDRSDIYIGIFAHRYGSGITEEEYRKAREKSLPCLIYFKDESIPVIPNYLEHDHDKAKKLDRIKRELKSNNIISIFKNPDHLATQVVADLHNLLINNPSGKEEGSKQSGSKYQLNITDAEGIVIGDGTHVTQNFGLQVPSQPISSYSVRFKDLQDNIHYDLALLKDYEDALRYEDDPRRRTKYIREVEQLRDSITRYQAKYDELKFISPSESPEAMKNIGNELQQIHAKLESIVADQSEIKTEIYDLHHVVLSRYDAGAQKIISILFDRLDRNQLITIESIQEAMEAGQISNRELQETMSIVQQTLSQIRKDQIIQNDPALVNDIKQISEAIDDAQLDASHKLKITIPIIPILLSYEGEIEFSNKTNLIKVWDNLIARIKVKNE